MVCCHLHTNMSINYTQVNAKPEYISPPLQGSPTDAVVLAMLVGKVNSPIYLFVQLLLCCTALPRVVQEL